MHGLDVIIRKNAEAAGREAAHALKDGNRDLAQRINAADIVLDSKEACTAWLVGYRRGRQEG
jgi:hypothetical protein